MPLIIYNKNIQNTIGVSISNYKLLRRKYTIYEENGKGKEYIWEEKGSDRLTFEGEYLKGKRNGKGKEYDNKGNKNFVGEYLNGKRNGKGKIYGYGGQLLFEGEFLNGEKNGKGKEYSIHCLNFSFEEGFEGLINEDENERAFINLIFEGEYLNGKKHGKGKDFEDSGKLLLEGEYLNGK